MQCQPGTPLLQGAAYQPELGNYYFTKIHFGDGQISDSRIKEQHRIQFPPYPVVIDLTWLFKIFTLGLEASVKNNKLNCVP